MSELGRACAWGVVISSVLVVLLVVPSPAFPIGSAGASAAPGTQWAFGAQRTVSASGTAADGNTSFTLQASYGWTTVITQQNGTGGRFQIEVNRTVGTSLYANYCRPDCTAATRTLNVSERLWETEVAFANLTTQGAVYSAGLATSGVALLNSSVHFRGNLTESVTASVDTLRGKAIASQRLDVASRGDAAVSFSPSLGLFPANLSESPWNSTADYLANGSWSFSASYRSVSFLGIQQAISNEYPGSFVDAQGVVLLNGASAGTQRLDTGKSTTVVGVSITGPFTLWEGMILVPNDADLLSTPQSGWATNSQGDQSASTESVDIGGPASTDHLPILASVARYQPSATDAGPVSLDSALSTSLGSTPPSSSGNSTPMDGPAPATIQAQPESVPAAQRSSQCLISTCSGGSGAWPGTRGLWLGVGVLLVAAVAASLVVAKRQPPRRDPPSRNAALYPRNTAPAAPPARLEGAGKPPSVPDAPDPLGNLW